MTHRGRKLRRLIAFTLCGLCFATLGAFADDNTVTDVIQSNPKDCLSDAQSNESMSICLDEIFSMLEGKRLILENTVKKKNFDTESTIDWDTFYTETLTNSRHFFEEYRKAECERKEILSSTGMESKYAKLTCQIRMTKNRIDALQ
tara:strand:+ start:16321 stop:16758 length:438 start_codon:yes stop_codon:yes gene_type:complete